MLADPNSAVSIFHYSYLNRADVSILTNLNLWGFCFQLDVACGENGAASGMAPGKGYCFLSFTV